MLGASGSACSALACRLLIVRWMGLRGTLHILPWMAEPSQRSPCRALLREDERTAGGLRPAIHRAARSHRSARWVACDGARSHRNSLSGRFRARRDVAPHPLAPGTLARSRSAADEEGSLAFTINATSKRHPPSVRPETCSRSETCASRACAATRPMCRNRRHRRVHTIPYEQAGKVRRCIIKTSELTYFKSDPRHISRFPDWIGQHRGQTGRLAGSARGDC